MSALQTPASLSLSKRCPSTLLRQKQEKGFDKLSQAGEGSWL